MTNGMLRGFEERLHGFEAKYHHDDELRFHVHARRDKLFGLWVAGALGRAGADATNYADGFVTVFEPHREQALKSRAALDLSMAGILMLEVELVAAFAEAEAEALRQIHAESEAIS